VFAGPNGSGKSTFVELMAQTEHNFPSLYINADDIARNKNMTALQAAEEADRQRSEAIENGWSFATETVLSTPDKLRFIEAARTAGYLINLIYVTTQSKKINKRRVEKRVQTGGHDVPSDKIEARYSRSMALLPEVLRIVDTAQVFNNSFDDPLLLAEKKVDGQIAVYAQKPPSLWDKKRIRKLVGLDSIVGEPSPLTPNL